MGRRGPKPTPTKILELRGSRIQGAHREHVQPEAIAPEMPRGLTPAARGEWKRVVSELDRLGILSRVNRASLTIYCEAWHRYWKNVRLLEAEGEVLDGPEGRPPVKNPRAAILKDAEMIMLRFAQEFGLTPSAVTRIKAPQPEAAKDPLGAFAKGKGSAKEA